MAGTWLIRQEMKKMRVIWDQEQARLSDSSNKSYIDFSRNLGVKKIEEFRNRENA